MIDELWKILISCSTYTYSHTLKNPFRSSLVSLAHPRFPLSPTSPMSRFTSLLYCPFTSLFIHPSCPLPHSNPLVYFSHSLFMSQPFPHRPFVFMYFAASLFSVSLCEQPLFSYCALISVFYQKCATVEHTEQSVFTYIYIYRQVSFLERRSDPWRGIRWFSLPSTNIEEKTASG